MSVAALIASGRRLAESLMLDTSTVYNLGTASTDDNGNVTTPRTQVYPNASFPVGRCKVQSSGLQAATPNAGGATFTVQDYRVDFPVGAFVPAIGQLIVITTATLDPNLAGRQYGVTSLLHKSQATAYRLGVSHVP